MTRAKKLVEQADKTAARLANPGKIRKAAVQAVPVLDLNVEAAPEDVEEEIRF